MRTHQLKTAQEGSRERPYNVRFLCWEDERGKIKQAAGRDTGNVIPPWTCTHARTHTLSLYKELVMQGVEPLESKYVAAPVCFPVCFFFFFFRECHLPRLPEADRSKPSSMSCIYARDVIPWTVQHSPSTRLLGVLPWGAGGWGWGWGTQQILGLKPESLSGLYITWRINLHMEKQLCDLIHSTIYCNHPKGQLKLHDINYPQSNSLRSRKYNQSVIILQIHPAVKMQAR